MPCKKKKYNARFPPGRIKKIMQTDEEVGKVAQAVPIIISRTLELFVHSLLTKTMQITNAKHAKTLSPSHMKQCILSESRFDFLKDLVKNLPDVSSPDDETQTPPALPPAHVVPTDSAVPSFAPKASVAGVANVSKEGTSCSQNSSRRNSVDKGDKICKLAKPVESNETVFSNNVPKFKMSVPTSFNASQPNFYTELNSNPSDNKASKSSSVNSPVSNFACTANIDEDYDT